MNPAGWLLLGWTHSYSEGDDVIRVAPGLRPLLADDAWCELVRSLALSGMHFGGLAHQKGQRYRLAFASVTLTADTEFVVSPDDPDQYALTDFWSFVDDVVFPPDGTWGKGFRNEDLFPADYRRALALLGELVDKAPDAVPEWLHGPVEGERPFRERLVARLAVLRAT
jgi:hypothetical protein